MSHQAFVLTRNNHVESTQNKGVHERFLSILPSCGFTITTGAIHPPRSVLANTHTFFIDADYCNPQAMLNLPVVSDYPHLNKVIFNAPESNVEFHFNALQKGINGIFHAEDNLELIVRGVQQVQAGNKWFSREIMSRYIDANLATKTKATSTIQATERIIITDLKGAMINRREMLQGMAAAAVAAPLLPNIAQAASAKDKPKRVIFFLQNNGFHTNTCIPVGMKKSASLSGAKFPQSIKPLEPYLDKISIINGVLVVYLVKDRVIGNHIFYGSPSYIF